MRLTFDGSRRRRLVAWTAIQAVLALGALPLGALRPLQSAQSPPPLKSAPSAHQRFPLAISRDPIELGVMPPGQAARCLLLVRNPLPGRATIERIETSCPCIGAGGLPVQIEPSQTIELEVAFDPSEAKDFRGRLSVDLTAFLADGQVGFRTKVNLEVGDGGRNR